jgi:hypothetical protein
MRRSLTMRIFASFVAAWFGFVTIQPLYGAPCPHHEPELAALSQGLGHGMRGSNAMAGHDMAGDAAPTMPGDHGAGHSHSHSHSRNRNCNCNCMGVCCGAAPVAIAQQSPQWAPAAIATQISISHRVAVTVEPTRPAPHSLPFATAPPRSLLA